MKKNSSILVNKNTIKSIAIGGFDGMHLAHQKLFSTLGENGAILAIETGYANLTPQKYRQEFSSYPIYYYLLENIRNLEGKEFITLLKEEFPNLEKIVIGFDFRFGKNRKYGIDELKKLFKGKIEVVNEIKIDNTPVHSRKIREYLKEGNIEFANKFLGRDYKIYGNIIKGQGLGAKNFVPTLNVNIKNFLLPQNAVYISKTIIKEKEYKSITFIGHRLTTDGNFAVETHILEDFIQSDNINLQIKFIKKIRENKKFDSFEDLKKQIFDDIKASNGFFDLLT